MTHSYGSLAISITASAIAFAVPFLMLYIFTALRHTEHEKAPRTPMTLVSLAGHLVLKDLELGSPESWTIDQRV